jgi:Camelysin metallo-endopeptidase
MSILKSKMTLAVAAAAGVSLVATVVIPRTLGFFDATTSNAGNSFSSGTLTMSNDHNGLVVTVSSNMKPGDVACGRVTIKNTGSLPAQVELSQSSVVGGGAASFGRALQMNIVQDGSFSSGCTLAAGGTSIYNSSFDSLPITPLTGNGTAGTGEAAGDWNAAEQHAYAIVVTFPNSGSATPPAFPATPNPTNSDNAYQNKSASATLNWYSTQSTVSVTTVTP